MINQEPEHRVLKVSAWNSDMGLIRQYSYITSIIH